jgi:glutathione S-transferase
MSEYRLVLGGKNYSSWSLRGWLAMKQTGAEFEEIVITFDREDRSEAIRRHSPTGLVPVLFDGDLAIPESLAIAEYLAERHPEAGLWPADQAGRATARAASAEMHAGFTALRSSLPMNFRRIRPGLDISEDVDADIARICEIWRDCRVQFGADGAFLFGRFSIADAMFAPVVSRFRTYEIPLDPTGRDYVEAVWSHPFLIEWAAAAETEPPVPQYDI